MYEFWVLARNTSCQLLFTASNRLAGHATSEWASSHYHMNESRLSLSDECLLSLSDPYCLPCVSLYHMNESPLTIRSVLPAMSYTWMSRDIALWNHCCLLRCKVSHPSSQPCYTHEYVSSHYEIRLPYHTYRSVESRTTQFLSPAMSHTWMKRGTPSCPFPCYITHMKDSSDTIKSLLPGTSQKSARSPTSLCCLHAQQHSLSARDNVSSC